MKYVYTEKDLCFITWKDFDEFIDKIYIDVYNYLNQNNLKIKYIVPIMRGGGIPAIVLSHMFDVVDCLPIQLKYNSVTKTIDEKLVLNYIENKNIKNNECVLLVEGNHATGKTANMAVEIIRRKFGEDTKIIYVSLTRDYTYRNSVKNICYTTWAKTTNETKTLTFEECKKFNLDYSLVSVYPWENEKEELNELNNN